MRYSVYENDCYTGVVREQKNFDNSGDSTTPSSSLSIRASATSAENNSNNTGISEKDNDDVVSTHDISNQPQTQAVERPEHEEEDSSDQFQLSQVEAQSQLSIELSIVNDGIREVIAASETEQPTTMRQARPSQGRRHVKKSNDDKSLNSANIYIRHRHSEIQPVRYEHSESVINR